MAASGKQHALWGCYIWHAHPTVIAGSGVAAADVSVWAARAPAAEPRGSAACACLVFIRCCAGHVPPELA